MHEQVGREANLPSGCVVASRQVERGSNQETLWYRKSKRCNENEEKFELRERLQNCQSWGKELLVIMRHESIR